MATETTHLRRRMQVLGHEDLTASPTALDEQVFEHATKGTGDEKHSFPLSVEYQSDSESSEGGSDLRSPVRKPKKSTLLSNSSVSETPSRRNSFPYSSEAPNSRTSWYEFDLSVVVALVSPIGNWLTGGDHVKNVLLLLLLIFYLHQIIEIPWALYNISRPRRPARPLNPGDQNTEERYKTAASSELHSLELFLLTLTVLSPLFGAFILRYVAATILGTDAVSWFSTSLFILATGIRPWKHLIQRFQQRIIDLHDVIHYPPVSVAASEDAQARLDEMVKRMGELEKAMSRVKVKMADVAEEVYDYVDDAMDGVEKAVRRHEKKCDATRGSQELHLAALDASVDSIKKGKATGVNISSSGRAHTRGSHSLSLAEWLFSFLPYTSVAAAPYPTSPRSPGGTMRSSKSSSKHRHFLSSSRLETIPEDVDFTSLDRSLPESPAVPASRRPPLLRIPGVNLALRCGDLATLPFRTVVYYLLSARVGPSTLRAS